MSEFFDNFIRMFEAMGPAPVQYGRNGVLKFGAERAEAVPSLETWSSTKAAVLTPTPPTAKTSAPIQSAAACKESDGRLDAVAGRVQAVTRIIAKMGICPEADCLRANPKIECRLYTCDECGKKMCALCMEMHETAGHVSDSDTAREMESR